MVTYIKRLLPIFLISIITHSYGQSISVSNKRENNLYLGLDNNLGIVVEGIKCDKFFVTTDNGEVSGSNCQYHINPKNVGIATILIYEKGGKVLIGKEIFRVKEIPKPVPYFAGKKSGIMDKNSFINGMGIIARLENFDIDLKFHILSFSVMILRNNEFIYKINSTGNLIPNELKEKFKNLKSEDEVIFYNIFIQRPDGVKERIESIDLIVE